MEPAEKAIVNDRRFALAGGVLLLVLDLVLFHAVDGLVPIKFVLLFLGLVLVVSASLTPDLFVTDREIPVLSQRAMGLTLSVILLLIAAYLFWQTAHTVYGITVVSLSLLCLITACILPRLFAGPAHYWMRFSHVLHLAMTPVLLALVYFGCFVPMGLALKVLGKDPLRRTADPGCNSYWIKRDPPGPDPESIKMQF